MGATCCLQRCICLRNTVVVPSALRSWIHFGQICLKMWRMLRVLALLYSSLEISMGTLLWSLTLRCPTIVTPPFWPPRRALA